jgi:hypothetical protein
VDDVFQGLTSLYFKNPVKLSPQYMVGQLIGSNTTRNTMISSTIPLTTLENICESTLSFSNVLVRTLFVLLYSHFTDRIITCLGLLGIS